MFYGVIHEDYEIIYEINFKEAISSIKNKIKKAIIALIDKIDGFLDKCKDGKIKSALKGLLSKVRNLLTKSNKISNQQDAKDCHDEYVKYGEEFNKIRSHENKSGEFDFTTEIKDYIDNKDYISITNYMVNMIRQGDFSQAKILLKILKENKSKLPGLFTDSSFKDIPQDRIGTFDKNDKSTWTYENLIRLSSNLDYDSHYDYYFSEELINLCIEVGKYYRTKEGLKIG